MGYRERRESASASRRPEDAGAASKTPRPLRSGARTRPQRGGAPEDHEPFRCRRGSSVVARRDIARACKRHARRKRPPPAVGLAFADSSIVILALPEIIAD